MKLVLILVRTMKKKIQVDNKGKKYILFRIDVYFTEYCLEILFLNKKDKRHQKKNVIVPFIRFNTSKENFDVDYETSKIQTFISQFKNNKIKK